VAKNALNLLKDTKESGESSSLKLTQYNEKLINESKQKK
jgi:hypothetical protein